MRKRLLITASLLVLCAAPSFGQDAKPNFLPQDALDLASILPSPPADDSAAGKAELAEVRRAQEQASAAEKAQALADTEEDAYVFAGVLGPNFKAEKLPVAAPFLDLVEKAQVEFTGPAKKRFNRLRPPIVDTAIVPCQKVAPNTSYPSGHSTTGYLLAVVLAQIVPEKRDAIFARAAEFAHNRVVCGVHYPSDIEAGKISGNAIAALLLDNPGFKAALVPAKAEIRKVLGLAAE